MVVLLILLSFFPSPIQAQGRMILFLLPGLDENILRMENTPTLDRLAEEGALALMNTRTGDGYSLPSTYLTLGAGRRAVTGIAGEPVLLENGEALLPHYQHLYCLNQEADYQAAPGYLGETLKANHLTRVLLLGSEALHALYLLMDGKGHLPEVYQSSPSSPSFSSLLKGLLSQISFLLVDMGPIKGSSLKKPGEGGISLEEADVVLGLLVEELHPQQDLLLLINPTPSTETRAQGSNLTPFLAWGHGIGPGVLTSSTTRQQALVSSLDLLPTLLSFFSLPEEVFLPGSKVASIPSPMTWEELEHLHAGFIHTARWRPLFIKSFVFFQIILLALLFLLFLWPTLPLQVPLSFLCRFLFFIPLVVLLQGFFPGELLPLIFLFLLVGIFPALFLPRFLPGSLEQFLLPVSITILALLLDLSLGPYLLGRSLLGYDPIIGARFYGIGNEYMGILIGGSVMGSMALWDRFPRTSFFFPTLLFYLIIILFLGIFFFGANLGGTFTALFTFSFLLLPLKRGTFLLLGLLLSLGLTVLLLLSLILVENRFFSPLQSHIGQTLDLFQEGGLQEISPIILRKLEMNLRLMRWTIWTRVLFSFLLFFILFFNRPSNFMAQSLKNYPHLQKGLWAAVLGSLVTMLVNDSGVVAMATTLFFPVFCIFSLILDTLE